MSPSQMARERMAEETARYHDRQHRRLMVTLLHPPQAMGEPQYSEAAWRADYHYREAEAARVRELAIQLEGFEVESLVRLCRRAA